MKVILKYSLGICMVLYGHNLVFSQVTHPDSFYITKGIIQGNDTLALIELEEVRVYKRSDFQYMTYKRRDIRLVKNVKKAYPYAKIAGSKLKELDVQLARIKSEPEQKKFIDIAEKEIMEEFEQEVKKLTITQGIILVKLIDRETGNTSYEVIKDLKGGITAFFWQGIARIFGNNLKAEYNPDGEDAQIEDIIRGIEAGFL